MNGTSGFGEAQSTTRRSSTNRLLHEQQHRFGTGACTILMFFIRSGRQPHLWASHHHKKQDSDGRQGTHQAESPKLGDSQRQQKNYPEDYAMNWSAA